MTKPSVQPIWSLSNSLPRHLNSMRFQRCEKLDASLNWPLTAACRAAAVVCTLCSTKFATSASRLSVSLTLIVPEGGCADVNMLRLFDELDPLRSEDIARNKSRSAARRAPSPPPPPPAVLRQCPRKRTDVAAAVAAAAVRTRRRFGEGRHHILFDPPSSAKTLDSSNCAALRQTYVASSSRPSLLSRNNRLRQQRRRWRWSTTAEEGEGCSWLIVHSEVTAALIRFCVLSQRSSLAPARHFSHARFAGD